MAPPQLTLAELYKVQKQKEKSRHISFDKVVELCHRRIRTVASYGGMNTFFEIPGMIIGLPLFNIQECMAYMIDTLRMNGFLVQILPPPHVAVLYISWDPKDVRPPVRKKTPAIEPSVYRSKETGILRMF
jgi:Family of unknown function (DUF5759)